MAKGSAELSEFAPTKFELMIDAGAAKLSAVLISCKHLAMFLHAGQPKCPNLAARGPMAEPARRLGSRRCSRNLRSAECFLSDCRPLQAVKVQSHGLNLPISHSNPLDAGYRSDRSISHEIVDDTNLVSIDKDLLISFREMMTQGDWVPQRSLPRPDRRRSRNSC